MTTIGQTAFLDPPGSKSGVFITQRGERFDHYQDGHDVAELEALVSGITQTTQATLLLKKKKEMREVDDALAFMKKEYKERMQACEAKQRKFEKNQQDMKEQVLKFEKFIQENDAKRHRAELKIKHERKMYDIKEKEHQQQMELQKQTEQEKAKLMSELARLRKYKDYLERTTDTDQNYEEVQDLLNRHKTLVDLNKDLQEQEAKMELKTDRIRVSLQQMQMEAQNQILVQSSLFYSEQKMLEQMRAKVKADMDEREAQEGRAKDAQRDTGEVVMAIKNLYTRCLATAGRTNIARLKDRDLALLEQLDFYLRVVQDRIIDLAEIVRDYEAWVKGRESKESKESGGGTAAASGSINNKDKDNNNRDSHSVMMRGDKSVATVSTTKKE